MKRLALFLVALLISLASGWAQAADSPAQAADSPAADDLLSQGIFQEDAKHDLNAAMQAYQAVISGTGASHETMATAIFRLAECFQKQEKDNKARPLYQRVLKEFSDQADLVKASHQQLAQLNAKRNKQQAQARADALAEDNQVQQLTADLQAHPDHIDAETDGLTPLQQALKKNQMKVIQYLLSAGANVNRPSAQGPPLYFYLASGGWRSDIVRLLLDKGASVDAKGPHGQTAMHIAAVQSRDAIVKMLFVQKASVNAVDDDGNTPLHLVARSGYNSMAKILLDFGADANAKNHAGQTPWVMAVNGGKGSMPDFLVAHGAEADPNQDFRVYQDRGWDRICQVQYDAAMDDLNHAISIDPDAYNAWKSRGFLKLIQDDIPGALADFNHIIKENPKFIDSFRGRAMIESMQGDWSGALLDYQQMQALQKSPSDYPADVVLHIWICRMQMNQPEIAARELQNWLDKQPDKDSNDWLIVAARLYLGTATEPEFFAIAGQSQILLPGAWYFAGMKRLLAGDKAVASGYLTQCAAGQVNRVYFEESLAPLLAAGELKAMYPTLKLRDFQVPGGNDPKAASLGE